VVSVESSDPGALKQAIKEYWEAEPCGTRDIPTEDRRAFFDRIERERYEWEPYIPEYAQFERARGKKLLEIGVGAGTDFINWVRHGAIATGVDLTQHGISLTKERLALPRTFRFRTPASMSSIPTASFTSRPIRRRRFAKRVAF
jgi:hypothetical protein